MSSVIEQTEEFISLSDSQEKRDMWEKKKKELVEMAQKWARGLAQIAKEAGICPQEILDSCLEQIAWKWTEQVERIAKEVKQYSGKRALKDCKKYEEWIKNIEQMVEEAQKWSKKELEYAEKETERLEKAEGALNYAEQEQNEGLIQSIEGQCKMKAWGNLGEWRILASEAQDWNDALEHVLAKR